MKLHSNSRKQNFATFLSPEENVQVLFTTQKEEKPQTSAKNIFYFLPLHKYFTGGRGKTKLNST